MPSGYTEGVQSGKITEFREYALLCVRAFGVCITMRDEPLSAKIPEFATSYYHKEQYARATQELADWQSADEPERRKRYQEELLSTKKYAEEQLAERSLQRQRYEAMLAKAKLFIPPTPDHENYATFLVKQLEDSINWDCGTEYYEQQLAAQAIPFEEWQANKESALQHNIEYHAKHWAEDVERCRDNNEWMRNLLDALNQGPVLVKNAESTT